MPRHAMSVSLLVLALAAAAVLALARPGEGQEPEKVFAIVYSPGPKWEEGKPVWQQPLKAHGDYMHSLFTQGKLIHGGPFLDHTGGLTIFRAASAEAAQAIFAKDPGHTSGVMKAELHPWLQVDWESYGKPKDAPEEKPAPAGAAVGTVIVDTARMAELIDFYGKGLGVTFRKYGEEHAGARVGPVYFGFDRKEKPAAAGPVSVWFAVDDLEATFEHFVSMGAKVRKKPETRPWGDRIAAVEDPDGNLVGLSQRK